MKKRSFFFRVIYILLIILIGLSVWSLYESKYCLDISFYKIENEQLSEPIRVVQLTDLHSSYFGENNEKLLSQVAEQSPTIILITGDLVNNKVDTEVSASISLIRQLTEIAPVYFSYGNQEIDIQERYGLDIKSLYTDAGATVLDFEYIDTIINEQSVRIGGIYGYCQTEVYAQETHREKESYFLKDFQDTDNYKVLMCHMPVCWIESGSLYDWDVDVVFSGHAHGGQIRLPYIGGLWAPDQGWFPGKECGVYTTDEDTWIKHTKEMIEWAKEMKFDASYYNSSYYQDRGYKPSYLILSRGLGSTEHIPRFNNTPEIVVVDIVPKERENAKDK